MSLNAALTGTMLLAATPALAQTASPADTGGKATPVAATNDDTGPVAPAPFTITGSAGVLTQYRFRGISQSDNKPVVQATFTVAHTSGLYLSVWGSSASANSAVDIGGTEIDIYGGYTHALGNSGVTVDGGVYGYIYPGSRDAVGIDESYLEIYGSLAKAVGPVTAKAGVYYAPDQHYFNRFATPTRFSVYEYGELSGAVPNTGLTLYGHLGHTGGGFDYAGHDYLDYAAGVGYKLKALLFDLSLVGTNLSRRDTRAADLAVGTTDSPRRQARAGRLSHRQLLKGSAMQDVLWVAIVLGLLALTLAYVRLCERA